MKSLDIRIGDDPAKIELEKTYIYSETYTNNYKSRLETRYPCCNKSAYVTTCKSIPSQKFDRKCKKCGEEYVIITFSSVNEHYKEVELTWWESSPY